MCVSEILNFVKKMHSLMTRQHKTEGNKVQNAIDN